MKKIIVYLITIIIFITILNKVTLLLIRKGNGYGTDVLNFYNQKNNSIDVLVLGSSHAYSAFNPYIIEDKTKLKTYNFCTQQQPIWITYHYLKEALKTQKPKYVILEMHMVIVKNDDYSEESVNRDAIDRMKFSINKLEVINASIKENSDKPSYYLPIFKYHTRYKSIEQGDIDAVLKGKTVDNRGYIGLPVVEYKFEKPDEKTSKKTKITKKNEKYLNKIIKLAKENKIKLILVKTPAKYEKKELAKINYLKEKIIKNKIVFLDYVNEMGKINLDYEKDFLDDGHLNKNGSEKFTNVFLKDSKIKK